MKKILTLLFALSILCLAAGIVWGGIAGTPHDMRTTGADQTCAFCHTPHQGTYSGYPLWNRTQGLVTYKMYTSPTFVMTAQNGPQFPSTACLTCHNGVTSTLVNYPAPGSIQNPAYDFAMTSRTSNYGIWANVGNDLSNDHPISFTYTNASAFDPGNNGFPGNSGTGINASGITFPLYTSGGQTGQFECATCHSVHDQGPSYTRMPWSTTTQTHTGTTVGTEVYFLRTSNVGSNLCSLCHTAK